MTSVAVICGLAAETRIATAHGFVVGCGGSNVRRASAEAQRLLRNGARALVSFGVAGGLDPSLRAGDLVVATDIAADGARWSSAPGWGDRVADRLPDCRRGTVAGAAFVVGDIAAKRALRDATGALVVDLESAAVARAAAAFGIPFIAVRAVADGADRAVPVVVASMVRPDGRIALGRVAMALAGSPGLIVTLGALAVANRRALTALAAAAIVLAGELPD